MTGLEHARPDIADRLDRLALTRRHLLLLLVIGGGLLFDQLEISMSTVMTAVFSAPGSGATRQQVTLLLLSAFAAGAIGAPLLGRLADVVGRKVVLQVIFAGFGFLSLASGLTHSLAVLTILRGATGFLLSAGPPLVASYLADVLPARLRGRTILLVAVFGTLGGIAAPLITYRANIAHPLGLEGWRWSLMGGGLAGIIFSALLAWQPESPRWLALKGREAEADAVCARLEASPVVVAAGGGPVPAFNATGSSNPRAARFTPRFLISLYVALQFLQTIGIAGFAVLAPTALTKRGITVDQSLLFASIISIGMPIGMIAASFVVDKLARRTLFVILSFALATAALAFGLSHAILPTLVAGIAFNLGISVYATVLQIYGAEMFPTRLRATAMGLGYAGNRVGALCIPVVLLPLLLDFGAPVLVTALAVATASAGVLAWVAGPRVQAGRAVK